MVTYTVHEPPAPAADRVDRSDGLEFVKDGFSWLTALFPPLGFIAERLWIPLVVYLIAVSAFVAALTKLGVFPAWTSLVVSALNLYLGFELSSLKRWSLDQQGWATLGAVTGHNLADCERRFFESWLQSQPAVAQARQTVSGSAAAAKSAKSGRLWPFGARG